MSSNKQSQNKSKGKPNNPKRRAKNSDQKSSNTTRGKPDPKNKGKKAPNNQPRKPQNREFQGRKNNFTLKINPSMKKPRQVSPRFWKNRDDLIKLYQPHGISDGDSWSHSKGEGITYLQLLKLPFYNDEQMLPENVVKSEDGYKTNQEMLNWDAYFDAIQKNFEGGYVPKYHSMKQKPRNQFGKQQTDGRFKEEKKFYDNNIEWDEIQQNMASNEPTANKAKPTKYQVQLKQISEDERTRIMKEIEQQEGHNSSHGALNPNIHQKQPGQPISIEELESKLVQPNSAKTEQTPIDIENIEKKLTQTKISCDTKGNSIDRIFDEDEDGGNQLIKSKENIDDNSDEECEFANVDVNQIKKLNKPLNLSEKTLPDDEKKVIEEPPKPATPEDTKEPENTEPTADPKDTQEAEGEENDPSEGEGEGEGENEDPQNKGRDEEELTDEQKLLLYQQYMAYQQNTMMQAQMQNNYAGNMSMSNPNMSYMSQNESFNSVNSSQYSDQMSVSNPFEVYMKENSNSHWYYKDPQGNIRGAFTTFDMHTWYTEGYFNEDLEISVDAHNFFNLKTLRMINKHNQSSGYPNFMTSHEQNMQQQNHMYNDPQMMSGYNDMNHMPEQYQNSMYGQQTNPNMGYNMQMQNQMAYQTYLQQQQQQQMSAYPGHPSGNYWP